MTEAGFITNRMLLAILAPAPVTRRGRDGDNEIVIRLLIAALIAGHGLVHGIMFALPYSPASERGHALQPEPFLADWGHQSLRPVLRLVVTLAFVVAGAAYLWRASWWPQVTVVAAGLSLILLILYFSKWWTVGYLISITLAITAWRAQTTT